MLLSFNHLITQVVEVEGGVGYSLVGDDADVYGLEVDGQLGEGGVDDILGRGFAHEVSRLYDDKAYHISYVQTHTLHLTHLIYAFPCALQGGDKLKMSESMMGAGPLLPVQGGIVGILRKASPFAKMSKQSKTLDAVQPSSTVDAEPTLDGNVDTLQAAKVRGMPFAALFSVLSSCFTL